MLGSKIKAFGAALAKADPARTVEALESDGKITLDIDGEATEITRDFVDVRISAKEGFAVAMENNVFTILDTTLDDDLIDEGLARELISKVQQIRKQQAFEMMDNIAITIDADDKVRNAVEKHKS